MDTQQQLKQLRKLLISKRINAIQGEDQLSKIKNKNNFKKEVISINAIIGILKEQYFFSNKKNKIGVA